MFMPVEPWSQSRLGKHSLTTNFLILCDVNSSFHATRFPNFQFLVFRVNGDTVLPAPASFRIISFRFIYIHVYTNSLFLFMTEQCFVVWIHYTVLIHSPIDGHLDCCQFWALQAKLLWISMSKSLHGPMLSLLLVNYLRTEWVGQTAGVCLTFGETHLVALFCISFMAEGVSLVW